MKTQGDVLHTALNHIAHEFLKTRRSIRRFQSTMPKRDILDRILSSAMIAPSAHNRQPWRFAVLIDAKVKKKLAHEMGRNLEADRKHDGDPEDAIRRDVNRSYERIAGAPVVILVALSMRDMDIYKDENRNRCEYIMAVQGAAMAAQNLLLAAHAEGLGGCWMCAPLFCASSVNSALCLPNDWQPQGLITLGYPAERGILKPRKAVEEIVAYLSSCKSEGTN